MLAIVGATASILFIWGLLHVTQTKLTDIISCAVLFGLIPLIAAAFIFFLGSRVPTRALTAGTIFVAVVLIVTAVVGSPWPGLLANLPFGSALAHPIYAACIVLLVWFLATRLMPLRSTPGFEVSQLVVNASLLFGLTLVLLIYSPRDTAAPLFSTMLSYMARIGAWNFSIWVLAGLAFAIAVLQLYRSELFLFTGHRKQVVAVSLLLGVAVVAGLYDDAHFVDFTHYQPYVAPALLAIAGGVPMVDVYCQYGLMPWLLIAAAYQVLPATLGTAAIVVRLVTLAYLLVFVLIAFKFSKRPLSAMLLMVPVLIAGTTFHPGLYDVPDIFNMNGLPSLTGMRYLPGALLALALTGDLNDRRILVLSIASLALSSVWSVEAFGFALLIWGGVVVAESIRNRDIRTAIKLAALGLGAMLVVHLAFALVVYLATGQIVNYWPYLNLALTVTSVAENEVTSRLPWSNPINYQLIWWIPIWLAYFLTIALAFTSALRGEPRDNAGRLLALALFGICALSYFATRSSTAALGLSFLPFATLFVIAFETLATRTSRGGSAVKLARNAAVVFFGLVAAFGFERFTRPVHASLSNSTILRYCFSTDGCTPGKIIARISDATTRTADPYYYRILNSEAPLRIADLQNLFATYVPTVKRVAALPDTGWDYFAGLVAFNATGQWYKWPVSSVVAEQQSHANTERVLTGSKLRKDEIFIVARPESGLLLIEQKILAKLRTDCTFSLVTETRFNSVYRVVSCSGASLDPGAGP